MNERKSPRHSVQSWSIVCRAKHPITLELRFGEELVRGAFVRERFAPLEVLIDVAQFIAVTRRLDINHNAIGSSRTVYH